MRDWHSKDMFSERPWRLPPFAPPFPYHLTHHRHLRHFMPYTLEATDTEYIITMLLPGYDVKNVTVSVKDNNILIEARKEPQAEEKKPRKIRSVGGFLWRRPHVETLIPVREAVDATTVKAKLSRGLLTVTFAKGERTKIGVEEQEE
jgi:HSP20 family protein